MGANSGIPWTDATYNPWAGCVEVSPACLNCYARTLSEFHKWAEWGVGKERDFFKTTKDQFLRLHRKAQRERKCLRVFSNALGDILDAEVEQKHRDDLWQLVEQCTWFDWLLLTKRVGNAKRMLPEKWMRDGLPDHVQFGITVVTQEEAERDIPKLLTIPARIRWLSIEPMLGPMDIRWWLGAGVYWVVVGGESERDDTKRRELDVQWLENIVGQCGAAGVPVWVKQDSAKKSGKQGRIPEDFWIHQFPRGRGEVICVDSERECA